MTKLRTAIIGAGYLGKFHAAKLATLPQSELIAVCDIDPERSKLVAAQHQTEALQDYRLLADKVDAVSIAVPTLLHHEVAMFFLRQGVHVLLEKPIATTIEQADELIKTAKQHKAILQIGHLERYNNVIKAVMPLLKRPVFVESTRLAPFKLRGTDVNVVLDLMIHDIDIIQSVGNSDIKDIRAHGASVLSPHFDIANARIEFNNGCVANVTASRVSMRTERKIRFFQPDSYVSLDLANKSFAYYRKGEKEMFPGIPEIKREEQGFEQGDALQEQIADFLDVIINKRKPLVSGEAGKQALITAIKINQTVLKAYENFPVEA